ncbi:MAG: hypothetical protein JSV78_06875 [Phycisphaerales bacterium]|nr:MAG: hypothetical protein JSV78_06875 [Phycisphaerales bacterium]
MGVHRSEVQRRRRKDATETKLVNRVRKNKERARRDTRITRELKAGSLPYSPAAMSWLSRKLDRKSSQITQEEVDGLLKEPQ